MSIYSCSTDVLFRKDWGCAWHRVAGGGFAGAAPISRTRADRAAARSLHDLADAAADRGGNASSGIPVGTGVTGGERAAEGEDGGHRWHDAGSERSHALDCATGYGRGLRGVSAATGRGIGD